MWTTFSEEEEQEISTTVTEGKELSYTYKNYIYRGKNWECPYAAQKITADITTVPYVKEFIPRIEYIK